MTVFDKFPKDNGSVALPYWLRVAIMAILPSMLVLAGLADGPFGADWPALVLWIYCPAILYIMIRSMHP